LKKVSGSFPVSEKQILLCTDKHPPGHHRRHHHLGTEWEHTFQMSFYLSRRLLGRDLHKTRRLSGAAVSQKNNGLPTHAVEKGRS